jgi:hypothetical protein
MEKIMEWLLAEMKAYHEKMMAEMKVQIGALVSWMDAHHAKTEANHEGVDGCSGSQLRKDGSPDECQSRDNEGPPRKDSGE